MCKKQPPPYLINRVIAFVGLRQKQTVSMSDNGVHPVDHMLGDDDNDDVASSDGIDEEYHTAAADDEDLDEYEMITRVTDTSAAQVRNGKDIQGIPWDRLNITRESYRLTRLEQYKNYQNLYSSHDAVAKGCKDLDRGGKPYEFFYNSRLVKPTILHFQLRNLVWATSKHDVYLISNNSVMHWSSLSQTLTEILNFSGNIMPTERPQGTSSSEGFTHMQLSTIAVKDRYLVAGGFHGELVCKCLDKPGVSFCARTTHQENAITNAIEIYDSSNGFHFTTSSNDCCVRQYDMERFQLCNNFRFPWPVNHTSASPDRKLLAVVGDDRDGLLVDATNGKTVGSVTGHCDYSFASAWHPNGAVFATGNQDKTCRVWDLRNLSSPLRILEGYIGAIRSIHFSSDGEFLVMAEPADFVHMYAASGENHQHQVIDFFGEISGVCLSPGDDESMYIGVWDRTYASLLQYNRRRSLEMYLGFV